jgi:hypothetical protein
MIIVQPDLSTSDSRLTVKLYKWPSTPSYGRRRRRREVPMDGGLPEGEQLRFLSRSPQRHDG